MDTVEIISVESYGVSADYAIIDHQDGSFTSMPKSQYEAQQAEQSTPIVLPDTIESTQPDEADLTEGTN
jgi:hypothetical protein